MTLDQPLFDDAVPKLISDGPMVVFDTETTGPDPQTARIVTYAVGVLHPDGQHSIDHGVIDAGEEIPEGAAAVHGWTTERLRASEEAVPPEVGIPMILQALYARRAPVVAFNARFDFTLLARECERLGIDTGPLQQLQVIDPLVLDKRLDKFRRGLRRLQVVAELNGVKLESWHDAAADALAAGLLAQAMLKKLAAGALGLSPALAKDPRALHDAQVDWAAEQARSLQAYFRSQGKDDVVETVWPIAPAGSVAS